MALLSNLSRILKFAQSVFVIFWTLKIFAFFTLFLCFTLNDLSFFGFSICVSRNRHSWIQWILFSVFLVRQPLKNQSVPYQQKKAFSVTKNKKKLCLIAASALSCGTWKECTVWPCHLHHQCTNEAYERKQSHHIRVLWRLCGGGIYSKAINTFKNSTVVLPGSMFCRC